MCLTITMDINISDEFAKDTSIKIPWNLLQSPSWKPGHVVWIQSPGYSRIASQELLFESGLLLLLHLFSNLYGLESVVGICDGVKKSGKIALSLFTKGFKIIFLFLLPVPLQTVT